MDIESLMINDWALHEGKPEKVNIGIFGELLSGTSVYFDIRDYEPIPLSDDFLKANGMKMDEKFVIPDERWGDDTIIEISRIGYILHEKEERVYHVYIRHHEINCFEGGFIHLHLKILYVHQLQHLLRDIGLPNLANNLKLK